MRRVSSGGFTPANPSLTFPIRAIFYYPWYPGGWVQQGYDPFTRYTPTLGAKYDASTPDSIEQHMAWLAGKVDAVICSWWGADVSGGSADLHPELEVDGKFPTILNAAVQHGIKVALYYEGEGEEGDNPSASVIAADLEHFSTRMAHPAWLKVDNRPVVFVYSSGDTSAGNVTTRWSDATSGYTTHYVSLKTFSNATSEPDQPDSWHQYGPANAVSRVTGDSYNISPGFWRIDEANPRLSRNLSTWQTNIADMIASGDDWHLITSFNEWGEGTQVEPTDELGSAYLDALG